jgi:hypothetical protein
MFQSFLSWLVSWDSSANAALARPPNALAKLARVASFGRTFSNDDNHPKFKDSATQPLNLQSLVTESEASVALWRLFQMS